MKRDSIISKLRSTLITCQCPTLASCIGGDITLSTDDINCRNIIGDEHHVSIDSTRSWRIIAPHWLRITPLRGGAGMTKIQIKCTGILNADCQKRMDNIVIKQDSATKSLKVTQKRLTEKEALLSLNRYGARLFGNKCTWYEFQPISEWKGVKISNGKVVEIDLHNHMLGLSTSVDRVASILSHLNKLKRLNLSSCSISGDINDFISSLSRHNKELEHLILDDNPFDKTTQITTDIYNLNHLRYISIENCNAPRKIPRAINKAAQDVIQDGIVCTLQKATKGKGVDFVIIGDGFIDEDMAKGGYFESLALDVCEALFAIEPTRSFREYFNVYAVKAVSTDRGCGAGKQTTFSTRLRYKTLDGNDDKCMRYTKKAPLGGERIVVINIVNGVDSGACCCTHSDGRIAYCPVNTIVEKRIGTLLHEAVGHGLGMLEDEYSTHDKRITKRAIEEQGVTGRNVDFTSDPAKIYWSDFLELERYKDSVGIFEGGLYHTKGVWRPSETSIMRDSTVMEFNAPSRCQIVMTTMKRAGVTFSFDDFLEYDKINLKRGKR